MKLAMAGLGFAAIALAVAATGCSRRTAPDEVRGERPQPERAAGAPRDRRYGVAAIPVVPCLEGRCLVAYAIDVETGEGTFLSGVHVSSAGGDAEAARSALLAGRAVAVGEIWPRDRMGSLDDAAFSRTEALVRGVDPTRCGAASDADRVLVTRAVEPGSAPAPDVRLIATCPETQTLTGRIAGDDQAVYLTGCGAWQVPKDGGPPIRLLAETDPHVLALDDEFVYLATWNELVRVPKGGGAPQHLAKSPGTAALAVDTTHLYFAAHRDPQQYVIGRVARGGGPVEQVAGGPGLTMTLALDATHVYFDRSLFSAGGVPQAILRVPKSGGTPVVVLQANGRTDGIVNVRDLTVVGDRIVWANWCNGCPIASAPAAGKGTMAALASAPETPPQAVAASGAELFWTSRDGGLRRTSIDGRSTVVLHRGGGTGLTDAAGGVYADARHVYWLRPVRELARTEALVRLAR